MLEFPNIANDAAKVITDALPDDISLEHHEGHKYIPARHIRPLADLLHLTIANVIATIIDAGSERDAVLEDEDLHDAILNQLDEWSYDA